MDLDQMRSAFTWNGFYMNQPIPKTSKGFILINLDKPHRSGTHWCFLYADDETAIYLDPYGFEPPKAVLNRTKGLNRYYSSQQIQREESTKCGQIVLKFAGLLKAAIRRHPGNMLGAIEEFDTHLINTEEDAY